MEYISIYKCRYCGKTFKGAITGNESIAFASIVYVCTDGYLTKDMSIKKQMMEKAYPHIEPGHYGVGDLIGIEKVGGES